MSMSFYARGLVNSVVERALGDAIKSIRDAGERVPDELETLLDSISGDYYEELGPTVPVDMAVESIDGNDYDFMVVDIEKLPPGVTKVALVMSY